MLYIYIFDLIISDAIAVSISLANQAQFLLINRTSVDWLVQKVDEWATDSSERPHDHLEDTVDRFRGNLIIETPTALQENEWTQIKFGVTDFRVQGPCTRCQMICIDQSTGEKTTEPLRTISKEFQGKVRFGVYLGQSFRNTTNASDREVYIECGYDVSVE